MNGDRVWVLEDPDEQPRVRKRPAVAPPQPQKNPNGQAKKGSLFLLCALIGLFAVPALLIIPFFWPRLDTATDRLFWETALVAVLVLSPLTLLIWLLNSFDALKVSLDDTKKEPVLKRIEYANNRRRMYGWGRGVFPSCKQTLVLALSLALCVAVAYDQFPRDYYVARLQSLQVQLSRQHLVLIPRLIDRVLQDVP